MTATREPTDQAAEPTRTGAPGLAWLSLVAMTLGVVLMASLHVVPPTHRIDPVRRTLSEYALGPNKWIFDLAVLLVAAGSALMLLDLVRRKVIRALSGAVLLGGVWTVSLLVIVAFTKTNWAVGPSMGGVIHRYASLAAYLALPFAVIMVANAAFPHAPGWRWASRAMGVVTLLWFGLILAGVVNMYALDGGPWWRFVPLGLVERAVAASGAAAIIVVMLGILLAPSTPRRLGAAARGRP